MHFNLMYDLPEGIFARMQNIIRITVDSNVMCCHVEFKQDAGCEFVYDDNFANCGSMFQHPGPRRSIWVLGILSLLGAIFVFVWRICYKEKNMAQSIILMHVAAADGLMAVYLITVGVMDGVWTGVYFLHDYQWRTGFPCQILGGISVLSSEVSLMVLSLLSLDRLKHIVFPRRFKVLTPRKAHALCFIIWVIGFFIAFLPTFGIRYFHNPDAGIYYYGKSVVCLPIQLTPDFLSGWEYSAAIFVGLNLVFVLFIITAYLLIFYTTWSSKWRMAQQGTRRERKMKSSSVNTNRNTSMTKRIVCIVMTDVLCWAPIMALGMRSAIDQQFTPRGDIAVWMAVFVLPINSAINPVLYTLSTPQVKKILGKKICKAWSYFRGVSTCCDDTQEDEQEQEGQDNGASEHDEEQERADGVLLESDLEGEKEDEKHVGNKQAETDLDKKEEADVKDATVKAKEKLPGEMISQEPGAVGPKAVKTESSRVEKTRKCARSKVSFHSVWEVAGGGKSCQEKDPKAHRENAAQGASLLAVIEEEAGDLKLTSVLDSKEAKGAKTKNDEPKAAEVTEAGNVDVADELPVPTDADITNVTGVEEIDARKPEKEGPGDGDAIEVTNASGGAGLLMETAGGEMAGDAIPKWVDAAHLTSEEQEVTLMVSTTDGGTAGVHPIHADVADPREALNMQQEEDVEIVKVPSAGEAEKVKVPKAESQEKVQGAITGNAGATDAKDAKIKRKTEA
ncbi:uncharacterized protein [Montipora capricornis]|uniref:uncharacterized protein n=1 Tax=Montipora capricornis TaxID=246305 RepID=UPI0035F1F391